MVDVLSFHSQGPRLISTGSFSHIPFEPNHGSLFFLVLWVKMALQVCSFSFSFRSPYLDLPYICQPFVYLPYLSLYVGFLELLSCILHSRANVKPVLTMLSNLSLLFVLRLPFHHV